MKAKNNTNENYRSLKRQLLLFQTIVVGLVLVNVFDWISVAIASTMQSISVSEINILDNKGKIRYQLYVDINNDLVESRRDGKGIDKYILKVAETGSVNMDIGSGKMDPGWSLKASANSSGVTDNLVITQRGGIRTGSIVLAAFEDRVMSGVMDRNSKDFAGVVNYGEVTRVSTVRNGKRRFSAELDQTGSGIFLIDKHEQPQFIMGLRESDNKLLKMIATTPGEEVWNTVSSVLTAKGIYELVK